LSIESEVALLLVQVRVTFWPTVIVDCDAVNVTDGSGVGGTGVLLLPLPQPVRVKIDARRTTREKCNSLFATETPPRKNVV